MPAIAITLAQLDALRPCAKRRDVVVAALDWSMPVDAAQAVAAGATLDDIVWVASSLSRHDPDVERRLRLWMADCAARVLYLFERERPTDMRPRKAIVAARRFARGEIEDTTMSRAGDAAWAAAWAAGAASGAAAWAAVRVARTAARAAGNAEAAGVAGGTARDVAGDTWDAGAAEERWQLDHLIARMSGDEPEDWPLPPPAAQCAA